MSDNTARPFVDNYEVSKAKRQVDGMILAQTFFECSARENMSAKMVRVLAEVFDANGMVDREVRWGFTYMSDIIARQRESDKWRIV